MRIIHDIDFPCQVTGAARDGTVYGAMRGEDVSHGFPVSCLISSLNLGGTEDSIWIEGNALYILNALETIAALIRHEGQRFVNEGLLHPDWNSMEAAKMRLEELKNERRIPRTSYHVDVPLENGWTATEIEVRKGSPIACVFVKHTREEQRTTMAAARFDLDKKMFIDGVDGRYPPLAATPEAVNNLADAVDRHCSNEEPCLLSNCSRCRSFPSGTGG